MQKIVVLAAASLILAGAVGYVLLGGAGTSDAAAGPAEAGVAAPAVPGATATLIAADRPAPAEPGAAEAPAVDGRRALASADPAAKESEEPSGPLYRGRVVDPAGRGVGDAVVKLSALDAGRASGVIGVLGNIITPSKSATTDGMGRFAVESPGGSTFEISVAADGFAPFSKDDVPLPESTSEPFEDLVLEPGTVLHGTVSDDAGAPIAGASLSLVDPDRGFDFEFGPGGDRADAETDENGVFELAQLAVGPWGLRVEAEGHPVRVFRGSTATAGRIAPPLRLVIPRGGTIRGVAVGLPEEKLEDLRVRANPADAGSFAALASRSAPQAELGEGGTFELRGLDPDRGYDVELIERGRGAFAMMGAGASRSEKVAVLPGAEGVELTYRQPARVRFQVTDRLTGAAVERFTANLGLAINQRRLTGPDGEELTFHADGVAEFDDLFPSDFEFFGGGASVRLMIQAEGYATERKEVEGIEEGAEIDLGVIGLTPAPPIRIHVTDAETGEPIRNARIRLEPLASEGDGGGPRQWMERMDLANQVQRAKTDSDGRAEVQSIPDVPCRLEVDRAGYAEYVRDDLLVTGSPVEIEVALGEGGEVEVFAVDPSGVRQPGVIVSHRAPGRDDSSGTRNTSKRNGARFRSLVAGAHSFRISNGHNAGKNNWRRAAGSGDEDGWVTVNVSNGTDLELTLPIRAASAISGVVRQAGQPLAGARVTANDIDADDDYDQELAHMLSLPRGGGGESGTTDGAGTFRIEGLEPATYLVAVSHPSRSQPTVERVELGPGEASVTFDLPLCAVEGRVVDGAGRGVAGVEVRVLPESHRFIDPDRSTGSFRANAGLEVIDVGVVGGEGPVPDAGRGTTDAQGQFRLTGLSPGVPLVVRADGDTVTPAVSAVFELDDDEVRTGLELEVRKAGIVIVEPVLAEGSSEGLLWVSVLAIPGDGVAATQAPAAAAEGDGAEPQPAPAVRARNGFTFGGGSVELTGLAPGRWTLTATQGGPGEGADPEGTAEVEVRPGETVRVEIVLQ